MTAIAIDQRHDALPVVVRVRGEVDFVTAPDVHERLRAAVCTGRDVVLDRRGVTRFTATGVRCARSPRIRRWARRRVA
jgi:anti-anti-sigma regulatory factor